MAHARTLAPTSSRPSEPPLFGVGFRSQHSQDLLGPPGDGVDWLEILSDNFLHLASIKHSILERLADRFPLSLHGVGLSVGSSDPLNQSYIQALKNLKESLHPLMISDHLSWTMHRGRNSHDLLPLPYTKESLHHVAGRVARIQETLGCRLYLENPSAYVAYRENHMPEAEFLARLCDMTGAGILLDVNNLYVNHVNLGLDPLAYLLHLDDTWVGYLHIAGHTPLGTALVDTHDRKVAAEVWNLYQTVVKRWPHVPTILEWDGQVPVLAVLVEELEIARRTHGCTHAPSEEPMGSEALGSSRPLPDPPYEIPKSLSLAQTQDLFFAMVTSSTHQSQSQLITTYLDPTRPVPMERGASVYRDAYILRLTKALRDVYPTIGWLLGAKMFDQTANEYFDQNPPSHFDIRYAGERFSPFLNMAKERLSDAAPNAMLSEIASLEWAKHKSAFHDPSRPRLSVIDLGRLAPEDWSSLRISFAPDMQLLKLGWNVRDVIDHLTTGQKPEEPEARSVHYMVYQKNETTFVDEAEPQEFELLTRLKTGLGFEEALHDLYGEDLSVANIGNAVQWLGEWCSREVVIGLHVPHEIQNRYAI